MNSQYDITKMLTDLNEALLAKEACLEGTDATTLGYQKLLERRKVMRDQLVIKVRELSTHSLPDRETALKLLMKDTQDLTASIKTLF